MPESSPRSRALVIVLMGVAGCGKTTVGTLLASQLGWIFRDGDAFHPPANIAKMAAGTPLNDADRAPWLASIRHFIEQQLAAGQSAVVACSALREEYRRVLSEGLPQVKLVHLSGNYDLILSRMGARQGHYMRPEMLTSQFATLEAPRDTLTVDIAQPPEAIVAEIRTSLSV